MRSYKKTSASVILKGSFYLESVDNQRHYQNVLYCLAASLSKQKIDTFEIDLGLQKNFCLGNTKRQIFLGKWHYQNVLHEIVDLSLQKYPASVILKGSFYLARGTIKMYCIRPTTSLSRQQIDTLEIVELSLRKNICLGNTKMQFFIGEPHCQNVHHLTCGQSWQSANRHLRNS